MYGVCQCCNEISTAENQELELCTSCNKNSCPECEDHHGKENCTYNHPSTKGKGNIEAKSIFK